jgi:hypothetical protein
MTEGVQRLTERCVRFVQTPMMQFWEHSTIVFAP